VTACSRGYLLKQEVQFPRRQVPIHMRIPLVLLSATHSRSLPCPARRAPSQISVTACLIR
jgi:hypothetical protein